MLQHLPNFLQMNKNYPVIVVPSNGKPDWYEGAYCLLFVYSKNNGNFILKGFNKEVTEYLQKNYTHYFYYKSMWSQGKSRGFWTFWKETVSIYEPNKKIKRFKYKVMLFDSKRFYERELLKTLEYKRLPKH